MSNSKNRGWVRLHRKITDNDLWFMEKFTKAQAWVDLFLNANHKESKICIRGNIISLKRGQIAWSELTMCKRWKWSKGKVRRYLKWLETEQQIVQRKDRYITTIISIIKYDEYQEDKKTVQQTVRPTDSRQYIDKNVKNVNNEKKGSPFSKSWNIPLRKDSQGKWWDISGGTGNWKEFVNGEDDIIYK